jgi:hypothetical protein
MQSPSLPGGVLVVEDAMAKIEVLSRKVQVLSIRD